MNQENIVITAGYDKSQFVLDVVNRLLNKGIRVNSVIVTKTINLRRITKVLGAQGFSGLFEAFIKSKGQSNGLNKDEISLKRWCRENEAMYLSVRDINSIKVENHLKSLNNALLLYGGGGIIRQNIIDVCDLGILNAHLGLLPQIRGMNAAEWNVLLNLPQAVSIHFIDKGIDTGNVLEKVYYDIDKINCRKDLRTRSLEEGAKALTDVVRNSGYRKVGEENLTMYRQCYSISAYMESILLNKLR